MKKSIRIILLGYCLAAASLLLFSYTQVDLSLTLSRASFIRTIETAFQQVGFYHRPQATVLYLAIITAFFLLYAAVLYLARKKKIDEKTIWKLSIILFVVLFFSYPAAFSYDIFNYVFTAKTIVVYHQNPYVFSPILFEHLDPMLSFMRWTHLPSAYTPLSIATTIIPYLLSFGQLLFSVWFIRAGFVLFYFVTIWAIGAIVRKENRYNAPFAMAFFALNPLVITEILVSGHNDGMMMALSLLAMIAYKNKQKLLSFFLLSTSIATKLMTVFLLPLPFIGWKKGRALLLLVLGLFLVLTKREFLPWYFLWVLPFLAIFPENPFVWFAGSGITLGLLLKYAPVFYTGGYDAPIPQIQLYGLIICSLIGGIFGILALRLKLQKETEIGPS